uniref:SEFIR domain-containing protein n=1 Tax=Timema monikensis TaxID=170555 RepID=A0A7R9HPD2_9NEOP|nr:unnamed protein product [Timema monikensis]
MKGVSLHERANLGQLKLQYPNSSSSDCTMNYIKRDTDASKGRDKELGYKDSDRPCTKRAKLQLKTVCSNLPFEGGVDQDWGHVMLKSYYYVLGTNKLTALNVTFSLIKWNSLRMRFKEVGGDKKNFCRDFHLSLEVPDSTVLFFDCLWSKAEYEKKSFGFEYEQRSALGSYAHRSYVFVVPSGDHINPTETELKNWELFMYVDISEIPKLTLRWPLAPSLFKEEPFNITAYNVSIYRRGPPPDDEEEEEEELLNTAIVSAWDAVGGELSYTFLTDGSETYWFTLRMIHEACGLQDCNVSKSHKIIISRMPYPPLWSPCPFPTANLDLSALWPHGPPCHTAFTHCPLYKVLYFCWDVTTQSFIFMWRMYQLSPVFSAGGNNRRTLIAIVCCSVLIPVFLCAFHVWRKRIPPDPQSQAKSLPVVFINYVPSHDAHVAFMVELTKYLRSHCAVDALMDRLDIPHFKSNDPHNWCIGEFERVDFVMVVSSPSTNQFVGIYKGVDQISLKLLKEKFGNSKSGLRYFSVQLPYCSEQDIPYEARQFIFSYPLLAPDLLAQDLESGAGLTGLFFSPDIPAVSPPLSIPKPLLIFSDTIEIGRPKGIVNQLLLRKSLLLMKFDPSSETLELANALVVLSSTAEDGETEVRISVGSRCVKRFHLMQDLDNMLRYIHNRGGGPLCSCMGPNIPGGRAELESNGRSLLQALDAAKAKIAKLPRSDDGADLSSYLIPDPDSPNMSQPKSSATTEGGTDSQEPLMSMEERQEPWRYDPPLRIDTSEFWNHPAARRDSSKKTPRGTIPIHHIAK